MSDKQVKSERLDELADEFMEDYLLDFSNGVRHLVREAYKSGLINAEANALTEDARGASELMRLVSTKPTDGELEKHILEHYHGFTEEQWNELRDEFPYCEIKTMLRRALEKYTKEA